MSYQSDINHDPNIIIVFDTETTGLSPKYDEIVQLSYIVYDVKERKVLFSTTLGDDIVAVTRTIPKKSTDVHGITTADTRVKGRHLIEDHINQFVYWTNMAGLIVGHNVGFDIRMVNASIEKIIKSYPKDQREEIAYRYFDFLMRFQPVGEGTDTFCTLKTSRSVCPKIYQVDKKKQKYKLDEVHKLLFRQEAKGQLHNALVDISATLRVFMKLKYNIDICVGVDGDASNISKLTSVANDNDICKLINPVDIPLDQVVPTVVYSGPLISGFTVLLGDDGLLEEEFNVETVVGKVLEEIVGKVMLSSIDLVPDSCLTKISVCTSVIRGGVKSGFTCGRDVVIGQGFCASASAFASASIVFSASASLKKKKKFNIISEEEMAALSNSIYEARGLKKKYSKRTHNKSKKRNKRSVRKH
jgi:DNA polymerase III epsilon subunit-like protein